MVLRRLAELAVPREHFVDIVCQEALVEVEAHCRCLALAMLLLKADATANYLLGDLLHTSMEVQVEVLLLRLRLD